VDRPHDVWDKQAGDSAGLNDGHLLALLDPAIGNVQNPRALVGILHPLQPDAEGLLAKHRLHDLLGGHLAGDQLLLGERAGVIADAAVVPLNRRLQKGNGVLGSKFFDGELSGQDVYSRGKSC
jgi:hypothetical protein